MKLKKSLAALGGLLVLWACTGTDADSVTSSKGGLDEPCGSGGVCLGGLSCVGGVCKMAGTSDDASPSPGNGNDASADEDVLDAAAADGADANCSSGKIYPGAVSNGEVGGAMWEEILGAKAEFDGVTAKLAVTAGANNRSLIAKAFPLTKRPVAKVVVRASARANSTTKLQAHLSDASKAFTVPGVEHETTTSLSPHEWVFDKITASVDASSIIIELRVNGLSTTVLELDYVSINVFSCAEK